MLIEKLTIYITILMLLSGCKAFEINDNQIEKINQTFSLVPNDYEGYIVTNEADYFVQIVLDKNSKKEYDFIILSNAVIESSDLFENPSRDNILVARGYVHQYTNSECILTIAEIYENSNTNKLITKPISSSDCTLKHGTQGFMQYVE